MKKQIKSQNVLAAQQANNLLFTSLHMNMEDILQASQVLNTHPERGAQIRETLHSLLNEELPKLKRELTIEELQLAAKNRVKDWTKYIGTPSMDQYVTLCKYWGISIGEVFGQELTPQIIYDMLNCSVVGQHEYKRRLSTSFHLYLMKKNGRSSDIDLPKCNLLVCGPSGSGKTYGVQTLSRYFRVPFVLIHCNTLVPEGIVGSNISDYFTGAWMESKAEKKKDKMAELSHAIVCFDEFDKVLENKEYGHTILNEILSLIDDGGEARFRVGYHYSNDYVTIPNKQMMFVFTGVFAGMDKVRTGDSLGFRNAASKPGKELDSQDLLNYGLKPEIVGRIMNYTTVDKLTVDDLCALLDSKVGSPLNDFFNYFRMNNIELCMTSDAKKLLVQTAYDRELGVRGLKSLINDVLRDEMFKLNKKTIKVDRSFVEKHLN